MGNVYSPNACCFARICVENFRKYGEHSDPWKPVDKFVLHLFQEY